MASQSAVAYIKRLSEIVPHNEHLPMKQCYKMGLFKWKWTGNETKWKRTGNETKWKWTRNETKWKWTGNETKWKWTGNETK